MLLGCLWNLRQCLSAFIVQLQKISGPAIVRVNNNELLSDHMEQKINTKSDKKHSVQMIGIMIFEGTLFSIRIFTIKCSTWISSEEFLRIFPFKLRFLVQITLEKKDCSVYRIKGDGDGNSTKLLLAQSIKWKKGKQ